VEIIEREATVVTLTESAAAKIKQLMAEEPDGESSVLRVAVQGGGCSGFEYALGFDSGAEDGDIEFQSGDITVVVDPSSAPYVAGAEIDYLDGLAASGFAVNNPNASSSCGCGHSFQVEEAAGAPAEAVGGCGSGCAH